MPLTFTQITAAGDPLSLNRHLLQFPTLPGGLDGQELTLRHTTVSLPPMTVGQLKATLWGWNLSFSGLRTFQNTFSVSFVETSKAPVIRTLVTWQDKAAGFKTHYSEKKNIYAINAKCYAYDTTGKKALSVGLLNVWPLSVTVAEFGEESGPVTVQAEFSVDALDFTEYELSERDFELGSNVSEGAKVSSLGTTNLSSRLSIYGLL